ncbi:MAG: peptidyl-prolyl cis-trans isomerase [Armatimonadetes bacterium]|nr:peptidyl-prolyl cis-trans isomerase [Armatimonadota bacterium]MBS1711428.1 peptidyl-prolyl cis-trans isomerase [Armatimonadota bacterium]MBX3107647.1 peptidyl-prolyl cis-trans isomerase [Fimbriimonadaceae bacterium]
MKRIALFAGALFALAVAAHAQEDRPMLVVNGQSIMRSNYIKRMEVLPGVGKQYGNTVVTAMPGFLTLQAMVNEMLTLQLAADQGVTPSEAQITEEIDFRTKENPDYVKAFTMLGFTMADLRYDVKVQLAEFNVITKGINIADAQVTRYYEDNKARFTKPKRYALRVIAVNSADSKKQVDAALSSGKKFADVAAEMSIDLTTKYDGGYMGEIAEESLSGEVKSLVTGLKAGQTTPWIKAPTSEVKIYLEKVLPEEVVKLDDVLKRKIRNKLMVDRGGVKNDMAKLMDEARKKARVEYQGTPFDDDLKQLFSGG